MELIRILAIKEHNLYNCLCKIVDSPIEKGSILQMKYSDKISDEILDLAKQILDMSGLDSEAAEDRRIAIVFKEMTNVLTSIENSEDVSKNILILKQALKMIESHDFKDKIESQFCNQMTVLTEKIQRVITAEESESPPNAKSLFVESLVRHIKCIRKDLEDYSAHLQDQALNTECHNLIVKESTNKQNR